MLHYRLLRFAILGLCLLVGLLPAGATGYAQGEDQFLQFNVPVTVNLVTGQTVIRTFAVTQGDSFVVRLTPLSDYTFTAVLIDPGQQIALPVPGPDGALTHQVSGAPQNGMYSLVIQATSGTGDMEVLVSSQDPAALSLPPGESVIDVQTSDVRYGLVPLSGLAGMMRLSLQAVSPVAGLTPDAMLPAITLHRSDMEGAALSVGAGTLSSLTVTLPSQVAYTLVVHAGQPGQQIRFGWAASEAPDSGEQPGQVATLAQPGGAGDSTPSSSSVGPCQVTFTGPVNVRSGPSLAHPIIGAGQPGLVFPVTGRNFDASWWQVSHGSGQTGWLSNQIDAVITQGDCSAVPQANFPAAPTATPTLTPTPMVTSTPTPTTSVTPMVSPTPTYTPTSTPANQPVATLNFSLPPSSGVASRTSGFVPDPAAFGMTGGGPVNVAYLGGGCSGYTASAPNLRVNYTAGAFPLLRFYFTGGADSTMVINTPGGSYICVDDSFGTLHPTIDFNSPASGAYDIWIGSFNAGGAVAGTLYVTENSGNHP